MQIETTVSGQSKQVPGDQYGSVQVVGVHTTKSAPASGQVTVTSSATLILAANPNRVRAYIAIASGNDIFIGRDNTVTAANGIPVPSGGGYPDETSKDAWYGITLAGTADVRVIEES
jgi:hypothetical protein